MRNQSSIPTWLWYSPVLTGWSYLVVFFLFLIVQGQSRYELIGDLIWNIGLIFIVASMVLFHKLNLNGTGRWRKFSLFIPVIGCLSYQTGAITGYFGEPIIIFYPLGALLTAIGMLVVGLQVAMSKKLKQWKRFTPLLVGLYPFLVMFPIVFITGNPSVYAILLWGIPWKILGCVLLSEFFKLRKAMA